MSNNKTLFQFLSKLIKSFFNLFDIINDKFFYNKKMQYLLLGNIVTLFVAPVIDSIAYDLEIYDNGALTALTTLAFSLFVVVVIISTISSWRNDDGNWTWEHAKANFYLYCYLIADGIEKIIDTEKKNKKIYSIVILLLSGIVIKAWPNVSATIRIFIEGIFDTKIFFLRSFEIWANTYYFIPIIAACVVFIFVRKSINNLLVTITNEILSLLGSKVFITNKKVDILVWQQKALSEPLISVRNKQQVDTLLQQIDHQPLKDLISVLKKIKPEDSFSEDKYRNELAEMLCKKKKEKKEKYHVLPEHRTKDNNGETIRFDILFDNNIVIELKRSYDKGAVDRAYGQVSGYLNAWQNKGLLVLVLMNCDYETASQKFATLISEQQQLNKMFIVIAVPAK